MPIFKKILPDKFHFCKTSMSLDKAVKPSGKNFRTATNFFYFLKNTALKSIYSPTSIIIQYILQFQRNKVS